LTGRLSVRVNGEAMELARGATVADVVSSVGCGERGVAVAVNSELLARTSWQSIELGEGDQVEILHAAAGG